jgi:imidazolonepropionase-like amidohydrolase
MAFSKRMVKALHNGGVPILVGTDSSDPGVVWGFSIHRELELLVAAGLTPFQALEAATRVPAEVVFGNPEEWGTVEVGKRADLLLLQGNPLEDISNTRQIAGVMVRGEWLPQVELQGMLDELAVKYEAQQEE